MIDKGIPIKNIYHMLCYYWEGRWRGFESFHNWDSIKSLHDLLPSLLITGVDYLYKRGFHKTYNNCSEELSTIRGKVNILDSSKPSMKFKKKVICDYDDYNADNVYNRIILSTIISMRKTTSNGDIRKALAREILLFKGVTIVEITRDSFNVLAYDRNNIGYRMLLKLCEFYWLDKISNEDKGKHKFIDVNNEETFEKLFEKFLLNFYCKHYHNLEPNAKRFDWKLSKDHDKPSTIEKLITDVTLTDKKNNRVLIIDAKYNTDVLENTRFSSGIRNGHVAQVYAYIHNHPDYGNSSIYGMLIYPQSNIELHTVFPLEDGHIYINTLDLNREWEEIEDQLRSFIKVIFDNS